MLPSIGRKLFLLFHWIKIKISGTSFVVGKKVQFFSRKGSVRVITIVSTPVVRIQQPLVNQDDIMAHLHVSPSCKNSVKPKRKFRLIDFILQLQTAQVKQLTYTDTPWMSDKQ